MQRDYASWFEPCRSFACHPRMCTRANCLFSVAATVHTTEPDPITNCAPAPWCNCVKKLKESQENQNGPDHEFCNEIFLRVPRDLGGERGTWLALALEPCMQQSQRLTRSTQLAAFLLLTTEQKVQQEPASVCLQEKYFNYASTQKRKRENDTYEKAPRTHVLCRFGDSAKLPGCPKSTAVEQELEVLRFPKHVPPFNHQQNEPGVSDKAVQRSGGLQQMAYLVSP